MRSAHSGHSARCRVQSWEAAAPHGLRYRCHMASRSLVRIAVVVSVVSGCGRSSDSSSLSRGDAGLAFDGNDLIRDTAIEAGTDAIDAAVTMATMGVLSAKVGGNPVTVNEDVWQRYLFGATTVSGASTNPP